MGERKGEKRTSDEGDEAAADLKRRAVATRDGPSELEGDSDQMINHFETNVEEDEWVDAGEDGYGEEDGAGDLDFEAVSVARREEIDFMKRLGVWQDATMEECMEKTGKMPVSTRWVDVDKGRDGKSEIRSRLVARDFKVRGDSREFDVFASMPPLEAKRLLFRMAASGQSIGDPKRGSVKLMFLDVKKAHLNGKLRDDEYEYVELPVEAGGGVGRLRRWLYGMRPAANAWEREYAAKLVESGGYLRGRAAPTVFVNPENGIRLVVWGDDFTFLGRDLDLRDMGEQMAEWYDVKVRGFVGPDPGDMKEIRILNRTIRWATNGVTYEADDKHVKTIVAGLGLQEDSKGSEFPLPREMDAAEGDEELDAGMAKRYRRLAATVNYLALDRPDLQFTAGVLGRTAARPTTRSWANLKKVGRYLISHPAMTFRYTWCDSGAVSKVIVYTDSDWAGCRVKRRSVSGGLATLGGGVLKGWSNRQASVALSSAEAELYAATKGAAEGLGIQSLMADLGWSAKVEIRTDANAARAMASRQGLGRARHIELRQMWLQEAVEQRSLTIGRVNGAENPADALTKLKSYTDMADLLLPVAVAPCCPRGER